jgi:hypothetical protein
MKNTVKFLGIIAFVAIIGFSFIACSGDSGGGPDSALNGTWINSANRSVKIALNNGNLSLYEDSIESARGTYSTSGNRITLNITQINGAMFGREASMYGISTSKWYTKQELRTTIINLYVAAGFTQAQAEALYNESVAEMANELFFSETATYILSGNTLTITDDEGETAIYTKQS